jgi:hypothetical protein
MSRKSKIPLLPSELPQQRIKLVVEMPVLDPMPSIIQAAKGTKTAKKMNRNADYICQLEWAWSPSRGNLLETKLRTLDQCYDHIIASIISMLDQNEQWRLERLDEEALIRKRAEVRSEARRKIKLDEHRRSFMHNITKKHHEILRINAWINELESLHIGSQYKNINRMIRWANGQVRMLKSQTSIKQIEAELSANKLFSDLYR